MDRRSFLRGAGAGIGAMLLAGCSTDTGSTPHSTPAPTTSTVTSTDRPSTADTRTDPETTTPEARTIYVDAEEGITAGAAGTEELPLASIDEALERAAPGDTVYVRPGEYRELIWTDRGGEPGAPITITGPADAVLKSHPEHFYMVRINHSHIHLRGLTIDGLKDPDHPRRIESYNRGSLLKAGPPHERDTYLEDLVIKPHRIGNSQRPLMNVYRSRNVEIGEFEVIGPAGAEYLYGDDPGHNGEIVYIGTAVPNLDREGYPWTGLDRTRNVHVHHIDNSAGHPHAELVDVKEGSSNVTIEYCTDGGGAARYLLDGHDETSETAFALSGRENVLRWCVVKGSQGQAVEVGTWGMAHPDEAEDYPDGLAEQGQANAIYGNEFRDYGGLAVRYPIVYTDDGERIAADFGPDEQAHVCGNEVDGPTHGSPDEDCPPFLPSADRIGHLGGDSPWQA